MILTEKSDEYLEKIYIVHCHEIRYEKTNVSLNRDVAMAV